MKSVHFNSKKRRALKYRPTTSRTRAVMAAHLIQRANEIRACSWLACAKTSTLTVAGFTNAYLALHQSANPGFGMQSPEFVVTNFIRRESHSLFLNALSKQGDVETTPYAVNVHAE